MKKKLQKYLTQDRERNYHDKSDLVSFLQKKCTTSPTSTNVESEKILIQKE